jgi:hypothetical protein
MDDPFKSSFTEQAVFLVYMFLPPSYQAAKLFPWKEDLSFTPLKVKR